MPLSERDVNTNFLEKKANKIRAAPLRGHLYLSEIGSVPVKGMLKGVPEMA